MYARCVNRFGNSLEVNHIFEQENPILKDKND